MKNILILPILLILISACGGETTPATGTPPKPAQTTPAPAETTNNGQTEADTSNADIEEPAPEQDNNKGFTLDYRDFTLYMDQNMEDVIAGMGEPLEVFEAPSCAFDGIDRIFRYPDFQIHTYPLNDEDFVHTISIKTDNITIYGGIYIGSSFDDVIAVYGENFEQDFSMFTFTRDRTTLAFYVEDGIAREITFGLIME